MNILIATDFIRTSLPDFKWSSKMWTDRTPGPFKKATVFWALTETLPAGFVKDEKYNWLIDGKESDAYFTPDILHAWHSESHGTGQLSRSPLVLYGQKRELSVHEKLAALAPTTSVIPAPATHRPGLNTKKEHVPQLCRQEVSLRLGRLAKEKQEKRAELNRELGAMDAECRRDIVEIFRLYDQPPFPMSLPS